MYRRFKDLLLYTVQVSILLQENCCRVSASCSGNGLCLNIKLSAEFRHLLEMAVLSFLLTQLIMPCWRDAYKSLGCVF